MYIGHHQLGNLYISDEKGRSFTLSIANVINTDAPDFQKVSSIEGTFMVNQYYDGIIKD